MHGAWLLLFALAGALPAAAQEVRTPPPEAPAPPASPAPVPLEPRRTEPQLTDEDREVVENLELLESLDAAADLEVLLELAEEK
ncbi:hypothetical protein D7V93_35650 [Corallococcus llansteffanensis]|uniref:Uncharacterized protein n=2 Tax=Corallococcus llansteffanensis TaxID=2316731 RepID=A0A3A8NSQ0_9BACT|nr:hypothetical protein D7V93_35650 [Corallococcus llansteffanensis]